MTNNSALSIIIINWNTIDLLDDCLSSVFNCLDRFDAEVFVVDNASSDGSQKMVKNRYPKAILIENSENVGFAAANNQAIAIAEGKYVLLLNSDTIVHDDVLQCSVGYMDTHDDVGVMGCRVLNTDGTLQPTCSQFPSLLNLILLTTGLWKLSWPAFFDRYQMRNWERKNEREVDVVSGCYMLVRSEAITQVGILDESFFFFGEETDWCKRFQNAGWKIRFAPVGHITHHGGGSVKKLNFKRDLMLSSATVKLHLKHGGLLHAITAWTILFIFNLTRAVYWLLKSIVNSSETTKERRIHFFMLIKNYYRVWPSDKTFAF